MAPDEGSHRLVWLTPAAGAIASALGLIEGVADGVSGIAKLAGGACG